MFVWCGDGGYGDDGYGVVMVFGLVFGLVFGCYLVIWKGLVRKGLSKGVIMRLFTSAQVKPRLPSETVLECLAI